MLNGCETSSFTIGEERLRVLENSTLRRIFGPQRDENGERRRLHNEDLYTWFLSTNTFITL
jgi:hypothetical protein